MNWESKAVIQAVLSRVPLGHRMHRKLQDVTGSVRDVAEANYAKHCRFIDVLRERGLPIPERRFLEVGTGWQPILPVLLRILGAAEVLTFDLNRWLTTASLEETLALIESKSEDFSFRFGVPEGRIHALARHLHESSADSGRSVDDALREEHIVYRSPADARATGLASGTLHYVVSTNVLEHVQPDALRSMLLESRRILIPGAHIVHQIDPSDHFSYDPRITTINFLRYSPSVWYYIGGSGLAYHNRLRCVDYVRLVEDCGFEIVEQATQTDPRALAALESGELRPHASFRRYSNQQLCERSIRIIARAPR